MRTLSEQEADSVNEYPLLFKHANGREERFSSQQTLRDGTFGIGLSLAREIRRDNLSKNESCGLFCTCTDPPIKLTLSERASRTQDDVSYIAIIPHHQGDNLRHRKDCVFYGERTQGLSAKHRNEDNGHWVYHLSSPVKREKAPVSENAVQGTDNRPDSIKQRVTQPTMSYSAYFREENIREFAVWNRFMRPKGADFLDTLWVHYLHRTEVRNNVTLAMSLKKQKAFRSLTVGYLDGVTPQQSRYGKGIFSYTLTVAFNHRPPKKVFAPKDKFDAALSHFKDTYQGADLTELLERGNVHILVCCRTPGGDEGRIFDCDWLTFLITDKNGLCADSVFEAECFNALGDALEESGSKEQCYYYKPLVTEHDYDTDRDFVADAYIALRKGGIKQAVIEAFGMDDEKYLKDKELKKSTCKLPLLYIDAFDKAHDRDVFSRDVAEFLRSKG